MAEEEIEKQAIDICNDLDTTVYNSEGGLIDVYDNMEIACRAGIKDGVKWGLEHAIEWHDLRINPDDLPKEKELVLLLICASVRVIGWYDDNKFIMDVNSRMFDKEDIIAWCELPKFEE